MRYRRVEYYAKRYAIVRRLMMTHISNVLVGVLSAAMAGALFNESKFTSVFILLIAFLFAIGYFDPNKNKKSVM